MPNPSHRRGSCSWTRPDTTRWLRRDRLEGVQTSSASPQAAGACSAARPSPSIKIATDTPLFQRIEEDMDINCGTLVEGHETVQGAGQRIFERILQVASGERTKSEQYDAGSAEFAPWPIGATV